MSTDLEKPAKKWTKYSTEDVEGALQLLALRSGSSRAVEAETGIPECTVRHWSQKTHADRYQQIRHDIIPRIQAKLAAKHEDMALQALDKQAEAFELMDLRDLKQPDLVKAARDLSVTAAVHTDKTQLLRDRPTQITEHRSASDWLADIARKFPQGVIDADAEEIADAEEV
jgi:hypothetical protein